MRKIILTIAEKSSFFSTKMLFIAAFVAWFAHIAIALPLWFP
jgi:hypothetical protein